MSHQAGGPLGEPLVIRLNLHFIECAVTSEPSRRSGGLIPFAGLGKYERYAEALGHELAHAVYFLTNPEYMGYYQELVRLRSVRGDKAGDEVIERLMLLIEEPADAAELEIWQEIKGQPRRKNSKPLNLASGRR